MLVLFGRFHLSKAIILELLPINLSKCVDTPRWISPTISENAPINLLS